MTAISWKNNADGNWNSAGNWSSGTVPGASDDVTVNTASAHTITYSGSTDSIGSLYFGAQDTLAFTGGQLSVLGNTTFYGALDQSNGVFALGGSGSAVYGSISQTAGTLKAISGTLSLYGALDSFKGTLSGATVNFAGGNDTIVAGAMVSLQQIELTGASLTLAENLTQAGTWLQSAGTLSAGSNNLTLSGSAAFDGGIVTGSGTVALSGQTEIGGTLFEGQVVLSNTGTIDQTGSFYLGYNGTDTSQLVNKAGALFRIDGDTVIYASAGATLRNAGSLIKTGSGGISTIQANVADTGTITVASGELRFGNGTDSFTGLINGAGTLDFNSGTDALNAGLTLSVASVLLDGANVNLTTSLGYAGTFQQTAGTLALGTSTLTLSNAAFDGGAVSGAGTLALTGTTDVAGAYLLGGTVIDNTGVLTQGGFLYLGYFGSDTASFDNAAGATWRIDGNNVVYGQTGDHIVNAGTLAKTLGGGSATIEVSTASTGTVTVGSGTLDFTGTSENFAGTVSGAGTLQLAGATTSFARGLKLTVGTTLLQGGVLTLASKLSYSGVWSQTGGALSLNGQTLTLNGPASFDGGNTTGSGTISLKTSEFSNYALEGSTVVKNAGALTEAGSLYVGYQTGDTAQLINSNKGSLLIEGNNAIYGSVGALLMNAGKIVKENGGGTSLVTVSTTSTGTVTAATGTLRFSGNGNSFAGTVNGAGTIELNAGADNFAAGLNIGVANLLLDGTTVTLGGALSDAHIFSQTAGTLALGGNVLTLTGLANFDGGIVAGAGTISMAGGEFSNNVFSGSAVLKNSGIVNVDGYSYIGYNTSDTVQLQNLAGATLNLDSNALLYGDSGSTIVNAGTIFKAGSATSLITDAITTTGTVIVDAGVLRFDGSGNSIGGVINGAGTLELDGGATSIAAGTTLKVGNVLLANSVMVTVASPLAYAGGWTQASGTLTLAGSTLTLSGQAAFGSAVIGGNGTVSVTGQGGIGGTALESSVVLANSGTITATSSFYVGYNSGDTAQLQNKAAGVLRLDNANVYGATGGLLTNAGAIVKNGSVGSSVNVATINSGTIEVAQGQLTFAAGVSGSGTITADAGTHLAFNGAVGSGGSVVMGAATDLYLNTTAGFADTIHGFALGDVIELGGLSYAATNTASFDAAHDVLTISNGSASATLQLAGTYVAGDFHLFNDNGAIGITHT